jgi:hypothetical protein
LSAMRVQGGGGARREKSWHGRLAHDSLRASGHDLRRPPTAGMRKCVVRGAMRRGDACVVLLAPAPLFVWETLPPGAGLPIPSRLLRAAIMPRRDPYRPTPRPSAWPRGRSQTCPRQPPCANCRHGSRTALRFHGGVMWGRQAEARRTKPTRAGSPCGGETPASQGLDLYRFPEGTNVNSPADGGMKPTATGAKNMNDRGDR